MNGEFQLAKKGALVDALADNRSSFKTCLKKYGKLSGTKMKKEMAAYKTAHPESESVADLIAEMDAENGED